MTKRDKIIAYCKENGIDLLRTPYVESDRWQRSGTFVVDEHFLKDDEQRKLNAMYHDTDCPIEIHTVRVNFEWQHGYSRLIWRGM